MIRREQTELLMVPILKGAGEIFNHDKMAVRMYVTAGLMDAEYNEIDDLVAFVTWSKANKQRNGWIATNLIHDIEGIRKQDECFLPRTSGYHKKLHG